ncbi:bile acid Fe-S flavoenzyme BaiCD [Peptacetobacter sp.]|uniref:bile acid Fe-S flavoenzyme BaiCD n=1 Tax=Peptacetobacter sp. TaxID=2991975 RepID=UPI00260A364C|nr:NAD(P)/FAD-dependent oxidoreductase [Peptacetobacter sp.]
MSYDALFSPFKIRGLELKNRIVLPGMNTKMVKNKHKISDDMIAYHVERAKAGCALNIFECVALCPAPHAYMYMGLYTDEHVEQLKKLTDAVHKVDGKMAIQLWHGGFSPQMFFDETNTLETPDTLSVERIHEIVEEFGRGAKRAVEAGFDAVEFHAAHSYLPHEFLSPGMNKRTDEYGGSFENRCRFCYEVVKAIRDNIPEEMPFFMRVDCIDELMDEVMSEEEIVKFINNCADLGVDIADLSRGNAQSFATVYEVPPFNLQHGFNIENIYNIKKQIKIPAMGVGRINTGEMANKVIAEGKFDLVGIGRAQLADPHWIEKVRNGKEDLIKHCVGCDQGCYDAVINPKMSHITCTRNPGLCLEYKEVKEVDEPKKVMIIGGGMAGISAAEVLKKRGHEPVIFEASDRLGGQFILAGKAPMKDDWVKAVEWENKEVERLGIEVRYNTKVTPELIEEFKPDHVVIAIGSDYVAPDIPGIDGENVYSQYQALNEDVKLSGHVAVVGCGWVGAEVAEYLAARGAQVTVIERKGVGTGLSMLRRMFIGPEFKYYKINKMSGTNVVGIEPGKLNYIMTDRKTKETIEGSLECDSVVICTGITKRPSENLQEKCNELKIPFNVIGDAASTRDLRIAAAEGYEVGMDI